MHMLLVCMPVQARFACKRGAQRTDRSPTSQEGQAGAAACRLLPHQLDQLRSSWVAHDWHKKP